MVIRHGEKPGSYNGAQYAGVNNLGTVANDDGAKHLVRRRSHGQTSSRSRRQPDGSFLTPRWRKADSNSQSHQ
jgi:hypothetical protein